MTTANDELSYGMLMLHDSSHSSTGLQNLNFYSANLSSPTLQISANKNNECAKIDDDLNDVLHTDGCNSNRAFQNAMNEMLMNGLYHPINFSPSNHLDTSSEFGSYLITPPDSTHHVSITNEMMMSTQPHIFWPSEDIASQTNNIDDKPIHAGWNQVMQTTVSNGMTHTSLDVGLSPLKRKRNGETNDCPETLNNHVNESSDITMIPDQSLSHSHLTLMMTPDSDTRLRRPPRTPSNEVSVRVEKNDNQHSFDLASLYSAHPLVKPQSTSSDPFYVPITSCVSESSHSSKNNTLPGCHDKTRVERFQKIARTSISSSGTSCTHSTDTQADNFGGDRVNDFSPGARAIMSEMNIVQQPSPKRRKSTSPSTLEHHSSSPPPTPSPLRSHVIANSASLVFDSHSTKLLKAKSNGLSESVLSTPRSVRKLRRPKRGAKSTSLAVNSGIGGSQDLQQAVNAFEVLQQFLSNPSVADFVTTQQCLTLGELGGRLKRRLDMRR